MNLPFRIFFVILCCLVGLIFPLAFLLAGLVAWTIWSDLTTPEPKMPEGHVDHTTLTASDPEWPRHFNERTESPAEIAFLEAMIRAFDLKPDKGRLSGKGMVLELQVEVPPYRLDFLVDRRLVVEVDGTAWHSSAEAVENDRRRDAEAHLATEPRRLSCGMVTQAPRGGVLIVARGGSGR